MMTPQPESEVPELAYKNLRFIDSDDGRPLRILAEYLEPLHRFRREQVQETVVFFGPARLSESGPLGRFYSEARELARLLTEWSSTLPGCCRFVVCSGGGGGIMEAANRGAADAGGRTIGLNIGLPYEQRPNPYVSPGLSLEFRYFLHAKTLVFPSRASARRFPRGLRYVGRDDGDPHALADAEARPRDRGRSLWCRLLA